MPIPTPRHRRKAGSGPPAAALIAWIGADARLYSAAAATADCQYKTDLRPSATARPARAPTASFALVCGALLAAAASISQGLWGPNEAALPPPVVPQDRDTQPDRHAPPNLPKQVQPIPEVSPAPAVGDTGGSSVVRQAPQYIPVPPPAEPVGQAADQAPAVPAHPAPVRAEPARPESVRPGGTITQGAPSPLGSGLGPTLNRGARSLGSPLNLGGR